jgi:hypothetical protein
MVLMEGEDAAAGRVTAWQCIGCGRVEGPRPCIGVCEDRKVEFVYAGEHEQALAQLKELRGQLKALAAIVRGLATITPREGEWERSYRALQGQARKALAELSTVSARSTAGK